MTARDLSPTHLPLADAGRKPRRGRRPRHDRGLPDERARHDLARTYLETQHRLWTAPGARRALAPPDDPHVRLLADAFCQRFLAAAVDPVRIETAAAPWHALGGVYVRYSCDNSNPRSLDQQLINALERAAKDGVFVPWAYVFADAAVTGTTANRRGYQMAKATVQDDEAGLAVLYIDEIGRASRDAIEALKLGRLIDKFGKQLVGVSDGFDSDSAHSKMMLTVFAMLHELFVDQLRAKVNRGMADAFALGKNIHPPALGYKLLPRLDDAGRPVITENGKLVNDLVVDEVTARHVGEAFRLLAEEHWSPARIGRRFNESKVAGKQTWDATNVLKLLRRETYIGVPCYGMTRQVRNAETGTVEVVRRPAEEWKRREVPHLRIISDELWHKAQARLRHCSEAYAPTLEKRRAGVRTAVYPKALLRPECGHCGATLILGRSGKYASFFCPNGIAGKRGCRLRTYKSVRLVEKVVLGYLGETVFTEGFLSQVLENANRFLAERSEQPREDTGPLLVEMKQVQEKRDRLVAILDRETKEDLDAVVDQVRRYERRLKGLRQQLAEAEARNTPPPAPPSSADVKALLADLHGLLAADVALAAPVLARLTGPIVVTQGEECGRKSTPWVARFSPDVGAALTELPLGRGGPAQEALQYVDRHREKTGNEVTVLIGEVPKYEGLAPRFKELRDRGASIHSIATAHGMTHHYVSQIIRFAETGERPKGNERPGTGKRKPPGPSYKEIAALVTELRDLENLTTLEILEELKRRGIEVSESTVLRAYGYAHREAIMKTIEAGAVPDRRRFRLLEQRQQAQIEGLLREGVKSVAQVAKEVGCSKGKVYRIRKELLGTAGDSVNGHTPS